jgi:hypothetical protein
LHRRDEFPGDLRRLDVAGERLCESSLDKERARLFDLL